MSEVSTVNTVTPAQEAPPVNPLDLVLKHHEEEPDETDEVDGADEDETPDADEKQLNVFLRKAEKVFCKGKKVEVLSRVECGKWCNEIYVLRDGLDRDFTSTLIFNRLAVHADSQRECNATELAHIYKCVELLCDAERWKAMAKQMPHPLTIGKLLQLKKLVRRVDGTEVYGVFDTAKAEQAKALFVWACGDGLVKKPALKDVENRVNELLDPVKYAQVQEQKKAEAAKAAEGKDAKAEDADEQEETPAPENLISTDAARPAAPDWKDVPDGMSAQYNEAMRQAPQEMAMVREQLMAKLAKLPVADVIGWMTAFFKEGC